MCRLLAEEHPDYAVEFKVERIENVVQNLQADQYDMVLGLSVFHHLCVLYGWQNVRELIGILARNVKVAVIELALKDEPVGWNKALPEDCRALLQRFSCTKLLAYNPTHLSTIQRPLFLASNNYIYFNDLGMLRIDEVSSHDIHAGKRVYYSCGDLFVKKYILMSMDTINEIKCACSFLAEYGAKLGNLPKIRMLDHCEDEFWVVMDRIRGKLLSDVISAKEDYDAWEIIRQTLMQLVTLERFGLYHDDVRTWNVMIKPDGNIMLIDFGAISKSKADCLLPRSLMLSFFMYMNVVLDHYDCGTERIRPLEMFTALKRHLPESTMAQILQLQDDSRMFATLYKILFESGNSLSGTCMTLADREISELGVITGELLREFFTLDEIVAKQAKELNNLKLQMNQILTLLQRLGNSKP